MDMLIRSQMRFTQCASNKLVEVKLPSVWFPNW